jgi:hypothetical protein
MAIRHFSLVAVPSANYFQYDVPAVPVASGCRGEALLRRLRNQTSGPMPGPRRVMSRAETRVFAVVGRELVFARNASIR